MNQEFRISRVLPICTGCDYAFSGDLDEKHCPKCRDEIAGSIESPAIFGWIGITIIIFAIVWLFWNIVFFMVS